MLVVILYLEVNKLLISKYGNGTLLKVEEFEKKLGIRFDDKYRLFLMKYNGGDTPNTIFGKGKKSETVRYLYGLNTVENIEKKLEYFDWKGKKCLPIGEDNFGNYYAIGVSEENNGIIYFCDHERGFYKTKLTNTFVDFIKKCQSDKINERAKRTIEEREQEMIKNGYSHLINDYLKNTWQQEYETYKDMVQEEVVL